MSPEVLDKILEIQGTQAEISAIQKVHTDMLNEQKVILAKNTDILAEHQRRSTQLEGRQAVLEANLAPIQRHLEELTGIKKIFSFFGGAVAVLASLATVMQVLFKIFHI